MNFCVRILGALVLTALATTTVGAENVPADNTALAPNVVGQVSERLLYDLVNMPVAQTNRVANNVLGTAVRGSVTTRGQVFPQLVPDAARGVLQLRFLGTSRSPNLIGRNGPATIFSSAVTQTNLWKTVIFNELGIRDLPTSGEARTQVSINGVQAQRRIVEFIARRRANSSRSQAQAITSQTTKGQISKEIDKGAKEPLATAHDYFINSFREPMRERGALPRLLRFSTTNDQLRLVMHQQGRSPQPAPGVMPTIDARHDLTLNLHESALNGIYEVVYGGATLKDRDILQVMDTITGDEPPALRIKKKQPRWSVTLPEVRPLELRFENGGVSLKLLVRSLKLDDRSYSGQFTVSVRYLIDKTAGLQLNRDGDVQVLGELPNDTAEDVAVAVAFLEQKLSGVFLPVLAPEGLALLADDLVGRLSKLVLVKMEANNGWLSIGYQLPGTVLAQKSKPLKVATTSMRQPTVSRPAVSQPMATRAAVAGATIQPTRIPVTGTYQPVNSSARVSAVSHRPTSQYRPAKRRGGCH